MLTTLPSLIRRKDVLRYGDAAQLRTLPVLPLVTAA